MDVKHTSKDFRYLRINIKKAIERGIITALDVQSRINQEFEYVDVCDLPVFNNDEKFFEDIRHKLDEANKNTYYGYCKKYRLFLLYTKIMKPSFGNRKPTSWPAIDYLGENADVLSEIHWDSKDEENFIENLKKSRTTKEENKAIVIVQPVKEEKTFCGNNIIDLDELKKERARLIINRNALNELFATQEAEEKEFLKKLEAAKIGLSSI